MNIAKNVNVFRKNILMFITRKLCNSRINQDSNPINKTEIQRILICRPNHRLGNQLLITPLIQEISENFPNCTIDLFLKGNLGPIIFKNYKDINEIIQLPQEHFKQMVQYIQGWFSIRKKKYDIAINADRNSSSGRLSTKLARSKYKFYGDNEADFQNIYPDYKHIAKNPIYSFRSYLSKLGINSNEHETPLLDIKLSSPEISEGKKLLQSIVENEEKTICLFTYATGSKCQTKLWWSELHNRLRSKYANINIIEILPVENVSSISFKEPTFHDKDIRKTGALMANTDIFIGADSGIMHLASAVRIPTIGLFSVTDPEIYGPYGNNSLSINTNVVTIDGIIKDIDKILDHKECDR